jgi:hypothetical protein
MKTMRALQLGLLVMVIALLAVMSSAVGAQNQTLPPLLITQQGHLWLVEPEGGLRHLTVEPYTHFVDIVINPANDQIAYVATSAADANPTPTLWVVGLDGSAPVKLAEGITAGFGAAFSDDGQILFPRNAANNQGPDYFVELYQIAPQAGAVETMIARYPILVGCGGGSTIPADWRVWNESGFGSYSILQQTPYGVVTSTACAGSSTGLLDLASGQVTPLGDGLSRAVISADESLMAAVKRGYDVANNQPTAALALVDLATREVRELPTAKLPDQLAWGLPGTGDLYYSVIETGAEMPLTDEQWVAFNDVIGIIEPQLRLNERMISIRRYNLNTGEDVEVYSGTGYAIGRMAVVEDGGRLLFSTIPNLTEWVNAILDGTIDPFSANWEVGEQQQLDLVPVSVHALDLAAGAVDLVGVDYNQMKPLIDARG